MQARQQAVADPVVPASEQAELAWVQPGSAAPSLSPNDAALFQRIRDGAPDAVGDDHVLQAVLESKRNGIQSAERVDRVMVAGDRLWVAGLIPGERASVDTAQPARSMDETARELSSESLQREQQWAIDTRQHENRGPSLV